MGYQSDYARTVADIYSQLGQGQAQARLQQGSAWANAFGQIGQTIGAIPGQMQDQKNAEAQRLRMAQQDARLATQDQLAATEREEKMFLRNAIASSMGKDGRVDHTRLQENLQLMGVGHIAAEATQTWQQMETGWQALQHGITQGITDKAALGKLRDDYLGPAAVQWQNAKPGLERDSIVEAAFLNLESKGLTQQAQELRATLKDDPKVFDATLNGLAVRYKPKPNVTNVPQGSVLVNEDTGKLVYDNPKPPDPMTLEQRHADAVARGDTAAAAFYLAEMGKVAGTKRAPTVATFEWARLPNGQVRYLTPQEIRKQGGAKVEAPRPNTEDEKKTIGFVHQVAQAIAIMDLVEDSLTKDELYQIQSLPQEGVAGWMNRSTTSENAKRYLRAMEQFTEAALRPVSGAAIQPSEYAQYRRTYGKQYGETPQLAIDRRNARSLIKSALEQRAGSLFTGDSPAPGADGGDGVPTPTGMVRMRDTNNVEQFVPSANVAMAEAGGWKRSGG